MLNQQSRIANRLRELLQVFRRQSRSFIRRILPPHIRNRFSVLRSIPLFLNFYYDNVRFQRWSATCRYTLTRDNLRARIIMDYHGIEKGLALRSPRPGFGVQLISRLLRNTHEYLDRFGSDEVVLISLECLTKYQEFNQSHHLEDTELEQSIMDLRQRNEIDATHCDAGGTLEVVREDILSAAKIDGARFFQSRHSIRQFTSEPIADDLLAQALQLAQYTPSVCNRQAWRVYIFSETRLIEEILKYQNGNRGFGTQASHIIIIACDLSYFVSIGERNQAWIDGGMYAMSLVYALHSVGAGTCCLNMSTELQADRGIRKAAGIRDSDAIIMMLAVGNLPSSCQVARSHRFDINSTVRRWAHSTTG